MADKPATVERVSPSRLHLQRADARVVAALAQLEEGEGLTPKYGAVRLEAPAVALEEGDALHLLHADTALGGGTLALAEGDTLTPQGADAPVESGTAELAEGEGLTPLEADVGVESGGLVLEGPWNPPWMPQDRPLSDFTASNLGYTAVPVPWFYLQFSEHDYVPKRIRDGWIRNTEATYWDGTELKTAAAHEPRIQTDPETGERYLLAEPQRTNLLLNSDALSGQAVTVSDATTYTLSFWGSGDVTLSNAHAQTVSGSGSSTRTTYTFTTSGTTLDLSVSGTVTNAQLEKGSFATSYISNGGSQTTRAPDDLSNLGIGMDAGAKSVYFYVEQEANGYDPNEGGNITNSTLNLVDSANTGTAGAGLLRPSTGIMGVSADGVIEAVINTSDEDLQGNSTTSAVDRLTIQPDKSPSTDGSIYRIHEIAAWEEERTYDERRSLVNNRPQPWLPLDAPNVNTLDTLDGDIDWSADVGISEAPHLSIDIPRFGIPAQMSSAWQGDTEATYWDSNGVLQTASAGVPRLARSYDGTSWNVDGVLAEPQRTNNFSYPRDPSQWNTPLNDPGFTGGQTGIDGTANAYKVYDQDGNGNARIVHNETIPDDSTGWTESFFLKKNTAGTFEYKCLMRPGSTELAFTLVIDPNANLEGTLGDNENGLVIGENWDDWWRIVATINNNGTGNTQYQTQINNLPSQSNAIIIDGFQLENHHAVATDGNGNADATHATMPILTGGATRSEDKLVMPVWWEQGIVSGGYYEALQKAGNKYGFNTGGQWQEAFFQVDDDQISWGESFGYNTGMAAVTDGTDFSSGASADGWVTQAANNNDGSKGKDEVQRLYILPDRDPSDVNGATLILRRLYLWPQELTEGSGGQLKALFDHDFSV